MNKQINQFIILTLVVVLGFVYAYFKFMFIPQYNELRDISAHLSQRQIYLARLQENYKVLSTLKQNVVELTVTETELKEKIPVELDYPDIMMTVYTMAKDNGLSPKNLSFESIKQEGQTVTLGMSFTCTGPKDNTHTLVEQFLNGNKYIFVLNSISYSRPEDEISANMKLTAYALQN